MHTMQYHYDFSWFVCLYLVKKGWGYGLTNGHIHAPSEISHHTDLDGWWNNEHAPCRHMAADLMREKQMEQWTQLIVLL